MVRKPCDRGAGRFQVRQTAVAAFTVQRKLQRKLQRPVHRLQTGVLRTANLDSLSQQGRRQRGPPVRERIYVAAIVRQLAKDKIASMLQAGHPAAHPDTNERRNPAQRAPALVPTAAWLLSCRALLLLFCCWPEAIRPLPGRVALCGPSAPFFLQPACKHPPDCWSLVLLQTRPRAQWTAAHSAVFSRPFPLKTASAAPDLLCCRFVPQRHQAPPKATLFPLAPHKQAGARCWGCPAVYALAMAAVAHALLLEQPASQLATPVAGAKRKPQEQRLKPWAPLLLPEPLS